MQANYGIVFLESRVQRAADYLVVVFVSRGTLYHGYCSVPNPTRRGLCHPHLASGPVLRGRQCWTAICWAVLH